MRVTCKHCGGPHPAFECRKKSTAARSERAEAAGKLQIADSPNGAPTNERLKRREAKQQVASQDDQPFQALPVDTNSVKAENKPHLTAGPSAPDTGVAVNHAASGGPAEANGASKFDRKAWMRDYQRNYMRNVYRPKLKASKSNPNTPERNDE